LEPFQAVIYACHKLKKVETARRSYHLHLCPARAIMVSAKQIACWSDGTILSRLQAEMAARILQEA
jgi:hypothetical protein